MAFAILLPAILLTLWLLGERLSRHPKFKRVQRMINELYDRNPYGFAALAGLPALLIGLRGLFAGDWSDLLLFLFMGLVPFLQARERQRKAQEQSTEEEI